jgi:Predicted phosphoesterase
MKTRIALLSDIHGNITALNAVLKDTKEQDINDYWILGDIIMHGPGSTDIFEKIYSLNPSVWVKGNWDDLFLYIADKKEIDLNDPSDVYVAKLGIDLLSKLSPKNIKDLKDLPLHTTKIINGLTISISHNLPKQNYGRALLPANDQKNFDSLFESNDADIAVYGHIHHQLMRHSSSDQLIINPGSIGYPFSDRTVLRKEGIAQYAILEIDSNGAQQIYFKQVKYDTEGEIKEAKNVELPYIDVYQKQIKYGISKSHDNKFLDNINKKNDYIDDVRKYYDL